MTKAKYRTRQQELLLSYLRQTQGAHVTAEDVRAHFDRTQNAIGIATVYRHLEKFVAEGVVTKYVIDEHSAACFEYVGESCGKDEKEQHFHLKCEDCGALIHLACDELACISAHLKKDHGFALDPFRTVFYGVCAKCREKEDTRR